MSRPARRRAVVAAVATLVTAVAASSAGGSSTTPAPGAAGPRPVYVALGNGETAGNGVKDRIRDAWPQIVYRTELPPTAIFVNFGETDATVADALADQLGPALALHPTVATVHLTDDRFQGTSVADYESELTELVRRLQRGGRTAVVLGTVLPEDREPGVLACTADPPPDGPRCRIGRVDDPTRSAARVDAMNAAIRRVADATGATVADVHGAFLRARAAGTEDALWAGNDFSPNQAGHRLLAREFGAAVRDALKSGR